MEHDLYLLIENYYTNHLPVDNKFVDKAFQIISTWFHINDLNLKISDDDKKFAEYDNVDSITIYRNHIIEMYREWETKIAKTPEELFDYSAIIFTIFHEIEHVRQFRYKQHMLCAEGLILTSEYSKVKSFIQEYFMNRDLVTFTKNMLTHRRIYEEFYLYSPSERLADLMALDNTIKVTELIKNEKNNLLLLLMYLKYIKRGYSKDVLIPSKYYLEAQQCEFDWNKIDFLSETINGTDRLKLGLDDRDNSINNINKKLARVKIKLSLLR